MNLMDFCRLFIYLLFHHCGYLSGQNKTKMPYLKNFRGEE